MRLLLAGLAALLLLAAPANAAITLGDPGTAAGIGYGGGSVFFQALDGGGFQYGAPSAGVLTSVSVRAARSSGTGTLRVLAVRGGSTGTVVGFGDLTVSAAPSGQVAAPARIPVALGDRLGVYVPPGTTLYANTAPSGGGATLSPTAVPPTKGQALGSPTPLGAVDLVISATLEPDGDRDGYGDETQDSCPSIPSLHTGRCSVDLRVSATPSATTIRRGDVATVRATVANASASGAAGTRVAVTVPPGLELLAAYSSAGECANGACPLGVVPGGASRRVTLVLRGRATGTSSVGFAAFSGVGDVAPANDRAAATVTVTPAAASRTRLCRVPDLEGKRKRAARRALRRAGCRPGRVRGRKGRVRRQAIPAGVRVVAGTKVAFRVKKGAKRG